MIMLMLSLSGAACTAPGIVVLITSLPVFVIASAVVLGACSPGMPGGGRPESIGTDSLAEARSRIEALAREAGLARMSFASNHAGVEQELASRDDMEWLMAHCGGACAAAREYLAADSTTAEILIPCISVIRRCGHTDAVGALLRFVRDVPIRTPADIEAVMSLEHPFVYAVRALNELSGCPLPQQYLDAPASSRDSLVLFLDRCHDAGRR